MVVLAEELAEVLVVGVAVTAEGNLKGVLPLLLVAAGAAAEGTFEVELEA